jgi:arylsulfatase A-like enzyme
MIHFARPRSAVVAAVLSVVALVSCSKEEPKPAAQPGQRRERVAIEVPAIRETADQDLRNSRACLMRVGNDERDAITAPFPGEITVDLPAAGSDLFPSALALVGYPKGKPTPRERLYFEFDFVGAKATQKSSMTLGFVEAISGWSPLVQARGTDGKVKLVIRGKWVGEAVPKDLPKDLPPLRMCLALPDLGVMGAPDENKPNVLVISVDTLRADHLSCYGYSRKTSPNIDALVARGAVFEDAYSSAPWTLPSYGSLFTGLLPADHRAGVVREREDAWGRDETPAGRTTDHLCADVPTLAEMLSAQGYQTAGFVCNPFLGAASGLSRGFQEYTSYQYNSQNGVDLALEWIGGRTKARWFLFLHVIDPHMPYAPPAGFDTRFAKTPIDDLKQYPPDLTALRAKEPDAATKQMLVDYYDGEIAFTDAQIGRLVKALDDQALLQNTLVVFHSDHGEEFWEHGSCDHGHTQYQELLHVPFALVLPGKIQAGQRVASRVRTLDLLPTVAQYVGFKAPAGIEGQSLVPVLQGRESADRPCISEGILHGTREIKAIQSGTMKVIASGAGTNVTFDLEKDPGEKQDIAGETEGPTLKIRADLKAHQDKAKARPCQSAPLELDEAARNRLNTIGYGGAGGVPAPSKKP